MNGRQARITAPPSNAHCAFANNQSDAVATIAVLAKGSVSASGDDYTLRVKLSFADLMAPMFAASPLRQPQFRLFYLGSLGTALGYTMQTTVAAWVMATLTTSEFMVALVQTASTAPS